jgi:hypothetical protein
MALTNYVSNYSNCWTFIAELDMLAYPTPLHNGTGSHSMD